MSVQVYDPIPGQFEHRSGDCALHGSSVPHARLRGAIGPYSCVACLLAAARTLADSPIVAPPPPERRTVSQASPPPPPPPGPPPPPPGPLQSRSRLPAATGAVRYKDAARMFRALLDPERELYQIIRGVARLCDIAAGPPTEHETCYRIVADLTHLDDSEPEFWTAHEYVLRERAQARAQGYSVGLSEAQRKSNGNGGSNIGRLYDALHVRYEALLSVARELNDLLSAPHWPADAWRAAHIRLRKVLHDSDR